MRGYLGLVAVVFDGDSDAVTYLWGCFPSSAWDEEGRGEIPNRREEGRLLIRTISSVTLGTVFRLFCHYLDIGAVLTFFPASGL